MIQSLKNGNLLLALLLELALLAAVGIWGWGAGGTLWLKIGLAVALVAIVVALWGRFAAPRSERRLKMPGLLVFKFVIFAVGTAAWVAAGQGFIGAVFGALAAIHLLAAWAFGQV